jgi:hypothetical protein
MLHRRRINKAWLKFFDKTVWLWRRLDFLLPWRGLSLIVIARNPGEPVQGHADAGAPDAAAYSGVPSTSLQ